MDADASQIDRSPRVSFLQPVRVVPLGGSPRAYRLQATNLSREGLFLTMQRPLDLGTQVALSLEAGGRALPFAEGEVVWNRGQGPGPDFVPTGFGVRFTRFLHPRARELVAAIIQARLAGVPVPLAPVVRPWRRRVQRAAASAGAVALAASLVGAFVFTRAAVDPDTAPVAILEDGARAPVADGELSGEALSGEELAPPPMTTPAAAAGEHAEVIAASPREEAVPEAGAREPGVRADLADAADPSAGEAPEGARGGRDAHRAGNGDEPGPGRTDVEVALAPAQPAPVERSEPAVPPARARGEGPGDQVQPLAGDEDARRERASRESARGVAKAPVAATRPDARKAGKASDQGSDKAKAGTSARTAARAPHADGHRREEPRAPVLRPPTARPLPAPRQVVLPSGGARRIAWDASRDEVRVSAELAPGAKLTRAWVMEGPPRLVFDIEGQAPRASHSVKAKGAGFKKVRVGRHGSATRIVIDLTRAPTSWMEEGGAVILSF